MFLPAANSDCFPVAHANLHAASNRAVAAGRFHPALGGAACRCVPQHRVVRVGVLFAEIIEAEQPLETGVGMRHAAAFFGVRYVEAMFLGTTAAKNR